MSASSTLIKHWLGQLATGASLSEADAEAAIETMMSGDATPAQIGAFLMAMRVRGETIAEITGAARAMRARAIPITAPPGAIDTCGTGGDAAGTFNISTAAAFVIAANGVPVAKHGNRAMSSKSGSSDVLTALGVDIDAPFERVQRALDTVGICFMMAQRHHTATRHVAPVRVEMGTRTIFNLLGPLTNPAKVRRQVMGVFAAQWVEPLAHVLNHLGSERAFVVHGDGLDELTTAGTSEIAALEGGTVRRFTLTPEAVGLPRAALSDLQGGTPADNAALLRLLFAGKTGPIRDIVALNAAAALLVAGKVDRLEDGIRRAGEAIDSGAAEAKLDQLIAVTQGHA